MQTGVLRNGVSLPSDKNGIAKFQDLRIEGATTQALYLWFSVQGKILTWHRANLKTMPILLNTTVTNVEFETFSTIDSTVVDGVPLKTITVSVKVICTHAYTCTHTHACACATMVCTKDANGTPLKNKWVFAMMPVVRGLRLGEGFQSPDEPNIATGAVTKRLENAMARTDDNGIATFSALTFTRRGQCGEYRIEFISDGVHSDETAPIQVFVTIAMQRSLPRSRFITRVCMPMCRCCQCSATASPACLPSLTFRFQPPP